MRRVFFYAIYHMKKLRPTDVKTSVLAGSWSRSEPGPFGWKLCAPSLHLVASIRGNCSVSINKWN